VPPLVLWIYHSSSFWWPLLTYTSLSFLDVVISTFPKGVKSASLFLFILCNFRVSNSDARAKPSIPKGSFPSRRMPSSPEENPPSRWLFTDPACIKWAAPFPQPDCLICPSPLMGPLLAVPFCPSNSMILRSRLFKAVSHRVRSRLVVGLLLYSCFLSFHFSINDFPIQVQPLWKPSSPLKLPQPLQQPLNGCFLRHYLEAIFFPPPFLPLESSLLVYSSGPYVLITHILHETLERFFQTFPNAVTVARPRHSSFLRVSSWKVNTESRKIKFFPFS